MAATGPHGRCGSSHISRPDAPLRLGRRGAGQPAQDRAPGRPRPAAAHPDRGGGPRRDRGRRGDGRRAAARRRRRLPGGPESHRPAAAGALGARRRRPASAPRGGGGRRAGRLGRGLSIRANPGGPTRPPGPRHRRTSGARGVDAAAHEELACHRYGRRARRRRRHDIYPPENEGLYRQIAERGCVVSESAPGRRAQAKNFPRLPTAA